MPPSATPLPMAFPQHLLPPHLTQRSALAIARLRTYAPPPTQYFSLPLSRRAAVLILLFPDRKGELRVLLTMRSKSLRNYSGHVALPGGKADAKTSGDGKKSWGNRDVEEEIETPWETARREAWEEVGVPLPKWDKEAGSNESQDASNTKLDPASLSSIHDTPLTPTLPAPFILEHLTQLPTHLAKTELGVRPCVALLYASPESVHTTTQSSRNGSSSDLEEKELPDVESTLIPRLQASEVAAVFSAPLHDFLSKNVEGVEQGKWYEGSWISWHEDNWRMHNFYVPVKNNTTRRSDNAKKKASSINSDDIGDNNTNDNTMNVHGEPDHRPSPSTASSDSSSTDTLSHYRVFGMTARILVDCARVAYAEEPEFEHNSHFGDEKVIGMLLEMGRLDGEKAKGKERGEFVNGEINGLLRGDEGTGWKVGNDDGETRESERGKL